MSKKFTGFEEVQGTYEKLAKPMKPLPSKK